jgi:hypothetical protein
MGSTSVTGASGAGETGQFTTKELSVLANAPAIIFAGITESVMITSPPTPGINSVSFVYPLPGGADSYVVILTSVNAGYVYVTDRVEDEEGNFSGFAFASETDGTIMYIVSKVGIRPELS